MAEVVLALVAVALLVDRVLAERRHHRERLDLIRVVVSRAPGAAARQVASEPGKPDKDGKAPPRRLIDAVPLDLQ